MTFPVLGGNGAVTGAYSIDNSLRFNDGDSPILTRTPSSAGNTQKFTYSTWFKRSVISSESYPFLNAGSNASNYFRLNFESNDTIAAFSISGGSTDFEYATNQVFRDTSAWYHLVFAVDTTNGTEGNRLRLYINGSEVTSFSTETHPSQNLSTDINGTTAHYIGRRTPANDGFYDGYLTETHLVDGQQLSPTDFGEFDEDSGIWKPKEYSGSYGTNGFYLDFENSGSLGADQSGNSNNFTPTNLASTDQTTDTPTNNFATLNSINLSSNITISEGNLKTTASAAWYSAIGTIYATSGKWYYEFALTTDNWIVVGVVPTSQDRDNHPGTGSGIKSMGLVFSDNSSRGDITYNGTNSAYTDGGHGIDAGDIISVALDLDNNNVKFYKNNSQLYNLSNLLSDEPYTFAVSHYLGSAGVSNFGQDGTFAGNKTAQNNSDGNGYGDFYYAPPSGYLALCTQNLATELSPTISDSSQYFNTAIWSGDGTDDRSITGVGFQPDTVWNKERNNAK